MESRPRIKFKLTTLDKNLELTGKLLLIILWSITIYSFIKLPTSIPIHFNASGKADGYGNKLTLLILPVFATIIYVGFTELNKYPHIFNYGVKITEHNASKQYTIATRMLRFIKVAILIIFSLIILFTYLTTIGVTNGLGVWFLPFIYAIILIPTIFSISQSFKKKNSMP